MSLSELHELYLLLNELRLESLNKLTQLLSGLLKLQVHRGDFHKKMMKHRMENNASGPVQEADD